VTATEAPEQQAPARAPRRCPRCGNELTPEQEWCLSCGADVGTTIARPPSWRGPIALVIGLLAIAAIAIVLALVELAGDAEQVTQQPAGQTPVASAAPTPAATATPESVTIPPATDDGTAGGTPEIADWPDGKDAWTVVLESSATQAAADSRAKELAAQGVPVGILNSDGYSSIEPGRFVVFSGQYDSKRAADQALQDVSAEATGGYVRHIIPKTSP
jgi:septal ring-binding cell division protein DamX